MCDTLGVSERRACRVLGQHRSTQRHLLRGRADEERLVEDMIELARQYGRYGYRRIAALLRDAGWQINDKPVERLWRREGVSGMLCLRPVLSLADEPFAEDDGELGPCL